jgi:hypothetical protein
MRFAREWSYAVLMKHLQKQFLDKARVLVREARADDFFSFLTVRKIAGGTATAQFYKAFPNGREELLDCLRAEVVPAEIDATGSMTTEQVLRLMQLVSDLKDREPEALEELRSVAIDNFRGDPEDDGVGTIVAGVLAVAAKHDQDAAKQLRSHYQGLTGENIGVFCMLLDAIGREPIPQLGGIENFAMVMTALFDGLAVRERIGDSAEEVLAAALLPIVAALTVSKKRDTRSAPELLYEASAG